MKKESTKLTKNQKIELKALEALPDEYIDTADALENLEWSNAERGVFYRPVKQQITLRLDADILHWFRIHARNGRGYQTDINRALRKHVAREATDGE